MESVCATAGEQSTAVATVIQRNRITLGIKSEMATNAVPSA